jgi:hypothetical protein
MTKNNIATEKTRQISRLSNMSVDIPFSDRCLNRAGKRNWSTDIGHNSPYRIAYMESHSLYKPR